MKTYKVFCCCYFCTYKQTLVVCVGLGAEIQGVANSKDALDNTHFSYPFSYKYTTVLTILFTKY